MARIFKEEGKLEIWKQKTNGRYDIIASYDICKWSGKLGPKFIEGDRQAPEGFYTVRPAQMNPKSSYHLAFNIGYPNAYDRAHGRTGANLMVHGACSSSGCYSMTDEQIEQIYAFGRDAFRGGQTEFQIQAFPFRMTAANMARYRNDPNYEFWKMLKEGYDHFEITKVPPKVDVCEKRYVFNRMPEGDGRLRPDRRLPADHAAGLADDAYQSYQTTYEAAFAPRVGKAARCRPKPTIARLKEAKLVSDWTKQARARRARADRAAVADDGRHGDRRPRAWAASIRRPDASRPRSTPRPPRRRRQAEAEEGASRWPRPRRRRRRQKLRPRPPQPAVATEPRRPPRQPPPRPRPAPAEKPGLLGSARKRITNIFGS